MVSLVSPLGHTKSFYLFFSSPGVFFSLCPDSSSDSFSLVHFSSSYVSFSPSSHAQQFVSVTLCTFHLNGMELTLVRSDRDSQSAALSACQVWPRCVSCVCACAYELANCPIHRLVIGTPILADPADLFVFVESVIIKFHKSQFVNLFDTLSLSVRHTEGNNKGASETQTSSIHMVSPHWKIWDDTKPLQKYSQYQLVLRDELISNRNQFFSRDDNWKKKIGKFYRWISAR